MIERERFGEINDVIRDATLESISDWDFGRHGLSISTINNDGFYDHLPIHSTIGIADFMPKDVAFLTHKDMTTNLLAGIEGLQDFFEEVDNGQPEPDYLLGITTQRRMAMATKRFGFTVREVSPSLYHTVGETKVIRQKLDGLIKKTDTQGYSIVDKLRNRAQNQKHY